MIITDHVNDLSAEFEYAPEPEEKQGAFSSFMAALTPRGRRAAMNIKDRSDYFKLRIFEIDRLGSKQLKSEGDGTFLSYV